MWANDSVLGTEISDTAQWIKSTIQWDFHDVKDEWVSAADFVYSNSLDHSFAPKFALEQWMKAVDKHGVLLIEHSETSWPSGSGVTFNVSDGASNGDMFFGSFSDYLKLASSVNGAEVVDVLPLYRSSVMGKFGQMSIKRRSESRIIIIGWSKCFCYKYGLYRSCC